MKQTILLIVILAFIVSGCATIRPDDAVVKIRGIAPQVGNCEIQLVQMSGSGTHTWRRPVNGRFEETFLLSLSDNEYIVEGVCGMVISVMKTVTFPKDAPLDIGTIRP